MIYTYLIGHGYVEDAMNTRAIWSVHTDEKDPQKAIEEFITVLRTAASNDEINDFLDEYFRYTADGLSSIEQFDDISGVDWWGTICDGPIISINGFNHFFSAEDEDDSDLLRCEFEVLNIKQGDTTRIESKEIWNNTVGKDVAKKEEEELSEGDRMFPDSMDMVYQIDKKGDILLITLMTLKAYNRGDGMKIHLDKTFGVGTAPCDIDFWIKRNVAKSSTMVMSLDASDSNNS